ncbi:MAG TPA: isoprenylcysteine carboxylmethyltransferase family protein [Candidatus Limnocylindrales bacterium]|nr:isoprenylcysteine carboxylmethyltransferase family protein [Candidatus Limnocylindrales bacterium]
MRHPPFLGNPESGVPAIVAFWILFYVWAISELYIGWRYRLPAGATRRDRGSQTVVIASVWAGVAGGIALAALAPAAEIRPGKDAIFVAGLTLMAIGIVLRWYAIAVLGRSFTVTVGTSAEQQVVERGPYRYVRHPSYTGSLLTIAGILLCCLNLLSLLAFLFPLAGYAYRIRVEERALQDGLGEPYRAYMRRTSRLIPFLL